MLAMTSTPDILAPYLVHFTTKPNAIESVQIYEKCLNDIQIDFSERLAMLRNQLDDVSTSCVHALFISHDFTHDVMISLIHSSVLNKHHKIAFCRFEMKSNA